MSEVKHYIDLFNSLHKCTVYKNDLVQLHADVVELNNPALAEVERKLKGIISQMNGKPVQISIDTPVKLPVVVKKVKKTKKHKVAIERPAKPAKKKQVLPTLKGTAGNQVTGERSKHKTVASALAGFTTADKAPDSPKNLFRLPGVIGDYLQNLQRYKLLFIIAGEFSSGKSEIAKQIADAFISNGDDVAWIDWEQGGLESKDTTASIARNIKPENKKHFHVSNTVPKNLEAVKKLTKRYKVIVLDSGSSLKIYTNDWIEELREQFPNTVWIVLMQLTTTGGTRGGSAAEFDAPVVIKTFRPDFNDYNKNYADLVKNRGNKTGLKYLISSKRILNGEVG